jgi:adenine/guanine phosphoribosyltransferase-like PRPP-binding protein
LLFVRDRKLDQELRAARSVLLCADATAVVVDDVLDNGET